MQQKRPNVSAFAIDILARRPFAHTSCEHCISSIKPVIEGLPSRLLRAWDKREFYERFLRAGDLRLRRLPFYKDIEDKKRVDAAEGLAQLKVPGFPTRITIDPKTLRPVGRSDELGHYNWELQITNPVYILCLSGPTVDPTHLRGFGDYIVEIFAPKPFCERVNACALNVALPQNRIVASIEWFHVRYDKGKELPQPEDVA